MFSFIKNRLNTLGYKKELADHVRKVEEVVFFCIGTDRSTGDSYGPFVGLYLEETLKNHSLKNVHVYGTIDDPINAVNLPDHLEKVKAQHPGALLVAIDACLGKVKSVGTIHLKEGPIYPGAGVKKKLPPVGDISITGVVNVSGFMEMEVLQCTRLSLVMNMAKRTASFIEEALLDAFPAEKNQNLLTK